MVERIATRRRAYALPSREPEAFSLESGDTQAYVAGAGYCYIDLIHRSLFNFRDYF